MNKTFYKSQVLKAIIPLSLPFIALSPYIVSNINKTIEYYDMQNITYVDVSDEFEQAYDTVFIMSNKLSSKHIAKSETLKKDLDGNYTYKMSSRGHEFIKSYETCKLTAYHIPGEKHNTIGWGHYLQEKHEQGIKKITQKRADELFMEDIAWVDKAVTDMLNDVNTSYAVCNDTPSFISTATDLVNGII